MLVLAVEVIRSLQKDKAPKHKYGSHSGPKLPKIEKVDASSRSMQLNTKKAKESRWAKYSHRCP